MNKCKSITACLFLTCSLVTGCGSGVSIDQPELGLVSGTVLFDGNPLAGAMVTFLPEDGRPASGVTNDSGVYELTYIRNTKGCKTGSCKVSISNEVESADEADREGDDFVQTKSKSKHFELPAKYNARTELMAHVKSGENTHDFQLTRK